LLQRLLPAAPLALVLLLADATPLAAAPTRDALDQCVVTWGSFCPVETIGFSLLGSLALTGFGFALWLALARLRDNAGRSGLDWVTAFLGLGLRFPVHTFAVVGLGVAAFFGL
jgi:hypothetical protein